MSIYKPKRLFAYFLTIIIILLNFSFTNYSNTVKVSDVAVAESVHGTEDKFLPSVAYPVYGKPALLTKCNIEAKNPEFLIEKSIF